MDSKTLPTPQQAPKNPTYRTDLHSGDIVQVTEAGHELHNCLAVVQSISQQTVRADIQIPYKGAAEVKLKRSALQLVGTNHSQLRVDNIVENLAECVKLVCQQSEDDELLVNAVTNSETYLQKALGSIHQKVLDTWEYV